MVQVEVLSLKGFGDFGWGYFCFSNRESLGYALSCLFGCWSDASFRCLFRRCSGASLDALFRFLCIVLVASLPTSLSTALPTSSGTVLVTSSGASLLQLLFFGRSEMNKYIRWIIRWKRASSNWKKRSLEKVNTSLAAGFIAHFLWIRVAHCSRLMASVIQILYVYTCSRLATRLTEDANRWISESELLKQNH